MNGPNARDEFLDGSWDSCCPPPDLGADQRGVPALVPRVRGSGAVKLRATRATRPEARPVGDVRARSLLPPAVASRRQAVGDDGVVSEAPGLPRTRSGAAASLHRSSHMGGSHDGADRGLSTSRSRPEGHLRSAIILVWRRPVPFCVVPGTRPDCPRRSWRDAPG